MAGSWLTFRMLNQMAGSWLTFRFEPDGWVLAHFQNFEPMAGSQLILTSRILNQMSGSWLTFRILNQTTGSWHTFRILNQMAGSWLTFRILNQMAGSWLIAAPEDFSSWEQFHPILSLPSSLPPEIKKMEQQNYSMSKTALQFLVRLDTVFSVSECCIQIRGTRHLLSHFLCTGTGMVPYQKMSVTRIRIQRIRAIGLPDPKIQQIFLACGYGSKSCSFTVNLVRLLNQNLKLSLIFYS